MAKNPYLTTASNIKISTERDIFNWNDKLFSVNTDKIYTFNNWSSTSAYKTQTEDSASSGKGKKSATTLSKKIKANKKKKDKGGNTIMPTSTEAGPELGKVSFEVYLDYRLGVNVLDEYKWWRDQCNLGTVSLMYLGTKQFGDYNWRIVGAEISDVKTSRNGNWLTGTMKLDFEEYYEKQKYSKDEKKATKLQQKIEKQMLKAMTAKNTKKADKAAQKAAKYMTQLDALNTKIATQKAEAYAIQAEKEKNAQNLITQYYMK